MVEYCSHCCYSYEKKSMLKAMFLRRMEKQADIAALAHHVVTEFTIPRRKGNRVQPSKIQYFFFTLIFKSIHSSLEVNTRNPGWSPPFINLCLWVSPCHLQQPAPSFETSSLKVEAWHLALVPGMWTPDLPFVVVFRYFQCSVWTSASSNISRCCSLKMHAYSDSVPLSGGLAPLSP